MFPFEVTKHSGRAKSRSGGKDYHAVLVVPADGGNSMLITRWAKAGEWGQEANVARYDSAAGAIEAWKSTYRKKFDKEYREVIIDTKLSADDEIALKGALGTYWHKMGLENARHLVPDCSPFGFGRLERDIEDARPLPPLKPAAPIVTQSERYADNPKYGSWS